MSRYIDRGMIKWAPFDALISYQDVLNKMRYERQKKEKPVLSDDQYEVLNRIILEAIKMANEVTVTYYDDGYFKTFYGHIKCYDDIKKALVFQCGFHLLVNQIIDADIC